MGRWACGARVNSLPSLIDRLRHCLASPFPAKRLAGDWAPDSAPPRHSIPAAVLMPVVKRADPGLLLTTRTAHLRNHAGQVAFPGGRIDPEDRDAVEAALREANEEIGLSASAVEVIGMDAPYETGSGYRIKPIVGLVPPDLSFQLSNHEVADLFEVPLAYVLDPKNHQQREAMFQNRLRRYYVIEWQGRTIWGATAGMLVNLSARLA